MARRIPDKALRTLGARRSGDDEAGGGINVLDEQKRRVQQETNPDFVAPRTGKFWTVEAQKRREAVRAALDARLSLFRDNIEAIRTANRVMNNAAIIQVMTAAENFITQIRSEAELEKQEILSRAQNQLLELLGDNLDDLERIRAIGRVPPELVDIRIDNAINEYAERCMKIAGLDFEFDKAKLLSLS